jgi:ubiquinone/menaquinone biosynthesis C-methylase UbiE
MDPRAYYRGDVAATYDASRRNKPQWQRESDTLAKLLDRIPAGLSVLDAPIGTGRFVPLYGQRFVFGADISPDMLGQVPNAVPLVLGDVTSLPLRSDSVGVAVCIRLLNLVDFETACAALHELRRVSNGFIVAGIRTQSSPMTRGDTLRERAWHFMRWGYRTARRRRPTSRVVAHRQTDVQRFLRDAGFDVIERRTVERLSDGSLYSFYLLAK